MPQSMTANAQRLRQRRASNLGYSVEKNRAYKARYPLKARAHKWVENHLRYGNIHREACEVCDDPKAEAHHDDYAKPHVVRWLCREHHLEWRRENPTADD
jgi:hypothetical protein